MKKIVNTKNAPKPIGPYSQAIKIKNIIVISGQIPIDIISGNIPDNIAEQTYIVLNHIKSIIISAGCRIDDIIKTTVFTTNLEKINIINEIYKKFFTDNKADFPARSLIEVSNLPKGAKIEIEAMALKR